MAGLSQNELLQMLLFDPRLDERLSAFQNDFSSLRLDADLPKLDLMLLGREGIKEVSHWNEIADDININENDSNALPSLFDHTYEKMIDLNKEVLFGLHSRKKEIHEFNKQLDKLVHFFKPHYRELHEKWMKWLLAIGLKYPRIEIYQFLRELAKIEVNKYQRVYMVEDNKRKRVFIEVPSLPSDMSSDEAKKEVIKYLTSVDSRLGKNKLPTDPLFAWYCWDKSLNRLSKQKILDSWQNEFPNEQQYGEIIYVTRSLRSYKKMYADYFQNIK